ncbi:hypothetical protein Ahy_B09g095416 [Arachis hypogaea]|uniref:Uncharacterized protein n=1 Tax=Arachis hypogaea TaxID=3818 RepID=A0A444XDU1_ARAHY|nr:hypothetical protein Ahy_B09g095416 [Arachis hypogaea]
MSRNSLLSICYDGEIVYDEEGSIAFRSGQPIFTYMTPELYSLTALKNLILHSVGQQEEKRVKKIYYRYPTEVDGSLFYKRYRLREDEDVRLIRSWHNRWTNVHPLELFVYLVEVGGRGSSADTVDNSPLSGAVRRTIRRTMVDLNMPPEGSQEGSNVEAFNPDDVDDADEEPVEIPDDGDEEEEMNYYSDTQIALTQSPSLDHMTGRIISRGPEKDPNNEFKIGQQFKDKEEVILVVKQYSIRRAMDYKIVESDQLRYNAQCIPFGTVVIGVYSYHIAGSKKSGRLGDTRRLILACKLRWDKTIVSWIRR